MLTRWEVEGALRNLHPMRQETRRVRRSRSRARRRVRVTVAVLLGIGLLAALGASRVRSSWIPGVATLQDTEWPQDHVGSYRQPARPPLFPPSKRQRWDSFAARAHAARDPITGAQRHRPRIAAE
jgi:hypothetical protein